MDSHPYRNVHDENPYTNKWTVIRTEMFMTKTHTKELTHKNMDSHSYRYVHDENPYKREMDSHSYRNEYDENPFTKKWIVIRTEMCMTKTNSQRNG